MTTRALTAPRGDLFRGIGRVADPKITLASAASMLLGGAIAAAHGPIEWGWLAITVLGIFFFEAAKNTSGEIFDFDSGADTELRADERSPFSGGKRILVDGLVTRTEAAILAAIFYTFGTTLGFAIVFFQEPRTLWLGVAGVALAFFYHAPPLRLSYRGAGELAVAIAYGPLIACGTYLVQRHEITREIIACSIPLGVLIGAFLWINEIPDARADALAGKRTLVVLLGRERASRWFAAIIAVAYISLAIVPLLGTSLGLWGGFIGLPLAWLAARRVRRNPEAIEQIIPAQGWTLMSFVLTAIGMSAGFLLVM